MKYVAVAILSCVITAHAASYYVSTSGTAGGTGAISDPWSLSRALESGAALAGDTVWIQGGTYSGGFSSFASGTAGNPITFKNYSGQRVIIDSPATNIICLQIKGTNTTWQGLEFTCSVPDRTLRDPGVYVQAQNSNTRLINLIAHDVGVGIYNESGTSPVEIYGCLIYNCGDAGALMKHGIYTHSNMPGGTIVKDNVILNGFWAGIHGYGEIDSTLDGFDIQGNICAEAGSLFGTSSRQVNIILGGVHFADNCVLSQNVGYFKGDTSQANLIVGYQDYENGTVTVSSNYFGRGTGQVNHWTNMTFTANEFHNISTYFAFTKSSGIQPYTWNNNYYGSPFPSPFAIDGVAKTWVEWKAETGYDASSTISADAATGSRVFVRPNVYTPERGAVAIFNWSLADTVAVDLSSICQVGNIYSIRNAADYFNVPVKSFTYAGVPVSFPLTNLTTATPVGISAPASTGPEFGAYIVEPLTTPTKVKSTTMKAHVIRGR